MAYMEIGEIRVDPWFAKRLPSPPDEVFRAFVEDVKERGILVDLLVSKDGLLLDGHRRLQAAKEAGLTHVPAQRLEVRGQDEWEKALAMAVNLYRRHLNEAQRAVLASSLLRLERKRAKNRQVEAGRKGGKTAGKGRKKQAVGNDSPEPIGEPDRSTERVARSVGISRKTLERVEAIKKKDPRLTQQMIGGALSVSAAYRKIKRCDTESDNPSTKLLEIAASFDRLSGRYRTVYLDLSSDFEDSTETTSGLCYEDLRKLPVRALGSSQGCSYWLWVTWAKVREGAVHKLLASWRLRWIEEIIYVPSVRGHSQAETGVLILAASGRPALTQAIAEPVFSLNRPSIEARQERCHSLIEELSPSPRIELSAWAQRDGWERPAW